MNMKHCLVITVCVSLVRHLYAGSFFPLPSTNAIVLNFNNGIPEAVRGRIREDFNRCYFPFASEVELYHFDRDPTNRLSLAGFWQPFSGFAATSGLGPNLPGKGILSNATFTIDISYAFATNYQHHIDSTAAYSNEIAAAYSFIESLSPTNLQMMSTNELLSLDLWKEVPPGQCPPSEDIDDILAYCQTRNVFAPPRAAFHIWECGPTNNPPYLWCTVPRLTGNGRISANMMLYFQGRWWFSTWPFVEGEQQW